MLLIPDVWTSTDATVTFRLVALQLPWQATDDEGGTNSTLGTPLVKAI